MDLEADLSNLHKELDELERDLAKLDGVEEKTEQAAEAVFEVVDDIPAEEPKPEE